jgi:HlyD family secretion protein
MAAKQKRWLGIALVLLLGSAALGALLSLSGRKETPPPAPPVTVKSEGVAALGRLEPEDGLVQVSAPYFAGRPSIVRQLLVSEGDRVRTGQTLAILDGRGPLEAALRQSEARVAVARSRLAQVKAGARPGELDAQKMEIARWQDEVANAETEYQRYEKLARSQDVSASELDEKRLALERARKTLQWAKDKLAGLAEIRPSDVDLAASELEAALAEERRVRADLELTVVRAPMAAQVVKVLARPGEDGSTRGIVELGKTDRMYAIAEVYETDVGRVRVGQKATVSGELLPAPITGAVAEIGMRIAKSELLPMDTASFADNRVVKVKVRLDDSRVAAGLIFGKVNVVIHP